MVMAEIPVRLCTGGGGPNELMTGTHFYSTTGIVARGRIYVAGDSKVYALAVPASSPTLRLRQQ